MKTVEAIQSDLLDRKDPGDLLPVVAYEEETGIFLMDDGYIGKMFLCQPLAGVEESLVKKLNSIYSANFPDESFIQFILWASPDINHFLESFDEVRELDEDNPRNRFLKKSMSAKKEMLLAATKEPISKHQQLRVRDLCCLVPIKIPFEGRIPSRSDFKILFDLSDEISETLKTIGMSPQSVNAEQYLHIMRTIVNWGDDALWRSAPEHPYNDEEPLRNQVFDYDNKLSRDEDSLYVKDKVIKSFSVRRWPKYFHLGQMQRLIGDIRHGARGIRDNFSYTLTVYFPPREKLTGKLEAKKQTVNYTAFGSMLKWVPRLALQKESFDSLFKEMDEGARPVKAYLQFTLFSDDKITAKKSAANLKTFFRETSLEVMEDPFMTLPIFLNGLPFGPEKAHIDKLKRYQTLTDTQVTHLMPVIGDWKGTGTPAVTLLSRNGQIMSLDFYDSNSNYNGIIAAKSGSGKSVLGNEIILNYLSMGGYVWVIDIGRSMEKLNYAAHGEFMVFSPEKNISLNPFPLVEDFQEQSESLRDLVCAMASQKGDLLEVQISKLAEIMAACWQEAGKDMSITMIATRCKENDDERMKDLGAQLYSFTDKGEYGRFFSGPNTIQFNNPFTVLELEELSGRKQLQQVVLLQLITQIQHAMYLGKKDVKKIVLLDESWDLLTQGNTARFMEHGYRRFRKYGGSAISLMQSINDLHTTSSGRAIAENSEFILMLGQNEATIQQLKNDGRISSSDWGFELMKSANTVKGQYSEIYCQTPGGEGIGRLYMDRFHQLLSTTLPKETHELNQLMGSGMTIEEAIDEKIKQERRGRERIVA